MENNRLQSLYDSYLLEANNKYPSQNYAMNVFQSPSNILEHYNDFTEIQDNFRKPFELESQDMADLNKSSNEDYLGRNYAMSFLTNNIQYYETADEGSSYMNDITNNINDLEQMSLEERVNFYNNNLSDLQKKSLELIGVDNENTFNDTVTAIQLNDDIENGTLRNTVVQEDGSTTEVDVTLEELLKSAGSGALAGAGLGSLAGPLGTVIGGITGLAIGAGTELADMISENDVIEGVNNAKRNFVSAMYGSTIGMVGDATAGIANVFNTGFSKLIGKEAEEIEQYNPLNMLEGVTDGIDQFLILKQKDEYSKFSKFLIADLPSVFGSLAGFAITGSVLGKAFGPGEITIKGKVLKRFFGGSYAELGTRSLVALQAMDQTFDNLTERGVSNDKAFQGSLLTGGLNWSVLAFTEAIPGLRTKNKLVDRFGKFAVKDILKHIPMEMAKEGAEEIGELMSQELGQSLGIGSAEFSNVKDYLYTGFLGAIGGAFGAGLGTLNYRKMINDTYVKQARHGPKVVDGIKEDYKRQGLSELEAKDRTIKELIDNGVNKIPDSVKDSFYLGQAEEFKESVIKFDKYVNERLKVEAEEIVRNTTDLDSKAENINKVVTLLNWSYTYEDASVRKELKENIELYARVKDNAQFDVISRLTNDEKAELKQLSQSQFNQRMNEAVEKGYNKFYAEFDKGIKANANMTELLRTWNLTKADIETMYQTQKITQEQHSNFNNIYNKELASLNHQFDTYVNNPNTTNVKFAKELFTNKKELFNYIQENYSKDTKEYLNMLKDFDLVSYDDSFKKIISLGDDIDKVINYEVTEDKTLQQNAEQLQKLKSLKAELKAEYKKLNRVPFELINDLSENDISLEKINEMVSLLNQDIRKQKLTATKQIAKEPLQLIRSEGVLSAKSQKVYYDMQVNKEISITNKLRNGFYTQLSNEASSFKTISQDLKEKYNLKDFNDVVVQMMLDKQVEGATKEQIEQDTFTVKERYMDLDVIGVGIDYLYGQRTDIKTYYIGDEIGEHTFYFDKNALIKELYLQNKYSSVVDEKGNTIDCTI